MKGLLFISVFCLTITFNISAQTTPQEMLNKAIYQEEVNGNLEEAIKLFSEIVNKNSTDRAVTVEALYHLGLSNEKLGNKKAREYYEKIVTGFTDQPEFVKVARERLLKLKEVVAENKREPKFHKIKFASNPDNGVLSPDGKKLAFMSDGGVWIVPLQGKVGQDIAGEPVRIADVPNLWEQSHLIEWSANGKWIAVYGGTVQQNENEGSVVSVIPVNGDKSRLVQLPDQGAHLWSYKFSLSPDGEMLAFAALEPGRSRREVLEVAKRLIFSIPTKGGLPRQISSGWANMPSFSPDGKFIVYIGYREKEQPQEGDSRWNSDLWVAPFDGGTPVKLTHSEGRLRSPVWSPDRRYIAALHEPGGTNYSAEIRIYPISPDASHAGKPEKIILPYGSWNMLPGWTPDNQLGVFIAKEEQFRVFTVPSSGGKAVQVTPDKGAPYYPRWSPDGTRIYYRGIDEEKGRIFPLFVPSSGGTPNEIKITSERGLVSCVPGGGQNISPDGKQILISAYQQPYDPKEGLDLWILPVNGGQAYRLTNDPSWERYPCWSADGKQIAFKGQFKDSNNKECEAIFILPAKGGMVKQITTEKDSVGGGAIAFSPDGKQIAFFSEGVIKTIPLEGGETRIIVPDVKSESHSQLVYSPDGTKIAYSCGGKIWLTSLKGGESEELQTGLPDDAMLSEFDWSPDGRKIAFLASSGGEPEFWLISDFLPPEKLEQSPDSELAEASKGITIKQVWTGSEADNSGKVSADGRYLSFTNWETGNLAIRNLKTEENIQLTNKATWDEPQQYAEFSMISPDSKQVAYLWYSDRGDKGYYELRLMQVGDTSYKNLYSCSKNEYMVPELWSSDSKKIIVQNYIGSTIWQLCSIDITSGEVQVLKEKTSRPLWIPNVSLSPDNKYLAFDYSNPSDKNNYDIYLMPVDSKDELPLIEHQANDRLLGWLPGTNELFFISDRSGNWNLYAVPVDKGKPSGPVKRIYGDIGEADPMGFTYSGDCFLGLHRNIYTNDILPFKAETGVVEEESGKSLAGSINFVKWSPDGKYLAYTKNYIQTNIPWHLTIQDLKTGEERQVANNLATAHSLSWSPDGNSILVIGHDRTKFNIKGYKGGIFLVNAKTGQAGEILNISDYKYNASEDEAFPLSDVEWSPDGKSFFYTFFTDRLVRHDLESGEEKILYKHDRFVRSILQRSPDGKNLLFGVYNQEKHKSYLMTIPVEGGKEKEICTSQEAPSFNSANWSPDGKFIYFIDSNGNDFWRVSAEGGMPQNIWSSKDWILRFSIHPNGKQLIIEKPKGITELRVIENLAQELERLKKTEK